MNTCLRKYLPLVAVTVILLVTACGQTGPLYLPEPSAQQAKQYEPGQNNQTQDKQKTQEKESE